MGSDIDKAAETIVLDTSIYRGQRCGISLSNQKVAALKISMYHQID